MGLSAATALCLAVLLSGIPAAAASPDKPIIAIIIDDLGHGLSVARRVISLPGPVACAVLPHTPHATAIAQDAARAGKEVLLHLPLQPAIQTRQSNAGELVLDTSHQEFSEKLAANLASIPNLAGVNTHMGSLLTRHPGHMQWLMQDLLQHEGLFFVDSYTTAASVALRLAREHGIPSTRRDVFIDSEVSAEGVRREFRRLKRLARERGSAVGIGHPNAVTLDYLEIMLPRLERDGFQIVGIEELIKLQNAREIMQDGSRANNALGGA
jgi:polysaccharide deacetylase 2 family uncharacterized protein YibQ